MCGIFLLVRALQYQKNRKTPICRVRYYSHTEVYILCLSLYVSLRETEICQETRYIS